ncbi:MAG: FAD-dependent oxidoreductase [Planctomycetota bacterium]
MLEEQSTKAKAAMPVVVVGGGIAGMVTAQLLRQSGCDVTLVEQESTLGGKVAGVTLDNGDVVDGFHMSIYDRDADLLQTLRDLRVDYDFVSSSARFGFFSEGQPYALKGIRDLLRFDPVSLRQRIKLGLFGTGFAENANGLTHKLDRTLGLSWLKERFDDAVIQRFWHPVVRAKMGRAAEAMSALWVHNRISYASKVMDTRLVRVKGGMRAIVRAATIDLDRLGVRILNNFHVDSVAIGPSRVSVKGPAGEIHGRRVVLAVPTNIAHEMLAAGGVPSIGALSISEYLNARVGVFGVMQPLGLPLHTVIDDDSIPFDLLIAPPWSVDASGKGVVYAVRTGVQEPEDPGSDDSILARMVVGVEKVAPEILVGNRIAGRRLLRWENYEPICGPGFLKRKPPFELAPGQLYMVNACQAYPLAPSLNNTVALAGRCVERIVSRERWESSAAANKKS